MLEPRPRRTCPTSISLGVLLLAGCFVGDAAEGLPCEQDADCGIGVACTQDPVTSTLCCGGSCLMGGPGSTSSGSTSGSTTSADTTGEPSSSSTAASESSTTSVPSCGNGVVDPGEECDPAVGPCTEDCLLCGNGVVDEGEYCDPQDEMLPQGSTCETCQELVLLSWDAADTSMAQTQADFDFPTFASDGNTLEWQLPSGPGDPLDSGAYVAQDVPLSGLTRGWPQSWLLSRPLAFPSLESGDEVVVTIEHAYAFDFEDAEPEVYFDHGRVDLIVDEGVDPQDEPWDPPPSGWIPLLPADGEGQLVECGSPPQPSATCFSGTTEPDPEAFCDGNESTRVLVGSSAGARSEEVFVSVQDASDATLRLSFRLRYDCANYEVGSFGWTVSRVRVVARRP